ncbi:MAG TPA: Nif3-like dinuclear metal center hexameric protein, partial [Clostridiales bacterium UBA8960]|nr:Nif3-like dinuclear metal center hexameric protein [Clostridiales bacterium UBA8960]
NTGLLVGKKNREVKNILLSLDVTEEVLNEAIEKKIDLLITHHPIIFSGIKTITTDDRLGKLLLKSIENGISIIAAHTNLDHSFEYGINRHISDLYGLKNVEILCDHDGFGIIGDLETPLNLHDLTRKTKDVFRADTIKYANLIENITFSRIAISSGASSDYIEDAIHKQADAFVTSDIKYHEAQKVLGTNMAIVDVGHFESEFLFLNPFKALLTSKLQSAPHTINIYVTESEKPIFKYI